MSATIRVLVIDDQEIFRLGLRVGLRRYNDICIEAEAEDGPAGLALAAEQKPDVAIVDVHLPGMDGIEVAERIQQISPATRIIVISGYLDDDSISRGLELGVTGIITKSDSPMQFACFIRRVREGVFCCSTTVLAKVIARPERVTWPDYEDAEVTATYPTAGSSCHTPDRIH